MRETARKAKLDALDGLRGFAASFVMLHHMATNHLLPHHPLLMHGGMLVDTFFVISGFVMAYQYGERMAGTGDFITFIRRRFARIWPLHATILLAMIAPRLFGVILYGTADSQLLQSGGHHSLGSWFASLALLHGMGVYNYAVWNGPSWTISVEFFVYFVFAACAVAKGRWLYRFAAILLAATTIVLVASGINLSVPLEFSFLRCIFGFFCGVMMFPLYRGVMASRLLIRRNIAIAEVVLGAAAVLLLWFSGTRSPLPLIFVPACGLLIVALATREGPLAQALATRPFRALGTWSLGIYLLHIPVLNVLFRAATHTTRFSLDFTEAGWGWLESLIFIISVIVLSALAHAVIEKPCRDWLGMHRTPRSTDAVFVAAPPVPEREAV